MEKNQYVSTFRQKYTSCIKYTVNVTVIEFLPEGSAARKEKEEGEEVKAI